MRFHEHKLITARFFAERIMPDTASLLQKIDAGRGKPDGAPGRGLLDRGGYHSPAIVFAKDNPGAAGHDRDMASCVATWRPPPTSQTRLDFVAAGPIVEHPRQDDEVRAQQEGERRSRHQRLRSGMA
jgi:hypothetical protein